MSDYYPNSRAELTTGRVNQTETQTGISAGEDGNYLGQKSACLLNVPVVFMLITGAIDDLWQNKKGEYIVVDYKATAKEEPVTKLDKDWHIGYKRQMEIYQWLLRQNGYKVSNTGYFVYCTGRLDREAFDGRLEFHVKLISYKGSDKWVEKTIMEAYKCLKSKKIPKANKDCDYCNYIKAVDKST